MFLNLAKFSVSWVLDYVASKFGCATELLVHFEDQLLGVDFAVAVVFVDFEESLVVVGLCRCVLKSLLAGRDSSLPSL